jgi:tetratricopeptide (TPR) repeat protein
LDRWTPRRYIKQLVPQIPIFNPLEKVRLFQKNHLIPLFLPEDTHFLPSGHKLIAYLLFNFLANKNEFDSKFPKKLSPFSQNHIDEAIINSDLALENKVKLDPFWEFSQAMMDKNRHKFSEAKEKLQYYIMKKPDIPYGYIQMGFILIKEKDYEGAANYFYKAKQKNKIEHLKNKINHFYTYASKFSKAWPFLQKGEFKRALPYLEDLGGQESPFKEEANNMLSLYYLKQGNMKMANFYKNKGNKNFQNILKQKLGFSAGN